MNRKTLMVPEKTQYIPWIRHCLEFLPVGHNQWWIQDLSKGCVEHCGARGKALTDAKLVTFICNFTDNIKLFDVRYCLSKSMFYFKKYSKYKYIDNIKFKQLQYT